MHLYSIHKAHNSNSDNDNDRKAATATAATMRSTALALSALTSLFVGSHAQASAECQALTAKFIVLVTAHAPQPLLLAAARRYPPTHVGSSPRARWPNTRQHQHDIVCSRIDW